jgi:hypothetical protein
MMKSIVTPIALLILLIGMVGIAAADPCPNPSTWNDPKRVAEDSLIKVFHAPVAGNEYEFLVWGSSTTGAKFHELCIADTSNANVWSAFTTIPTWDGEIKSPSGEYFIQWKSHTGSDMFPMDGSTYKVGTSTFYDVNSLKTLKTLVHVDGKEYCKTKYPNKNDDSCYILPEPPSQPVPELSPLILTSAGLLGIVLVSRKNKR